MSNSWNTGNVVVLKSGGPPMTVEKVDDEGVHCVWFIKEDPKASLEGVFSPGILEGGSPGMWKR